MNIPDDARRRPREPGAPDPSRNGAGRRNLIDGTRLRMFTTEPMPTGDYTLAPALRSVRTEVAAELSGTVGVSCPTDTTRSAGGAVYLFEASGVVPDDGESLQLGRG